MSSVARADGAGSASSPLTLYHAESGTPSAAAADVLSQVVGIPTENTAKWLAENARNTLRHEQIKHLQERLRRASPSLHTRVRTDKLRALIQEFQQWSLSPGQLVIVDEASMAGTFDLGHADHPSPPSRSEGAARRGLGSALTCRNRGRVRPACQRPWRCTRTPRCAQVRPRVGTRGLPRAAQRPRGCHRHLRQQRSDQRRRPGSDARRPLRRLARRHRRW